MSRRRVSAIVVAALALALAACATPPEPRPQAVPVPAVECGDGFSPPEGLPTPGGVPAEFSAVAAYRCDALRHFDDEHGSWSATARDRLEGDLGPLLEALAEPDDPRWPGACPAMQVIVPELWLIDASGDAIRVAYPSDGCRQPRTARVEAALAGLDVVETVYERHRLIDSAEARRAECLASRPATPLRIVAPHALPDGALPDEALSEDMVAHPLPRPGISTLPVPAPSREAGVDGLRVCVYSTDPAHAPAPTGSDDTAFAPSDTAWFTGARTLDAATTRLLLDVIETAEPADAQCASVPRTLVALYPTLGAREAGESFAVELDGCERIILWGAITHAAPAAALDLLRAAVAS
ncbi:hypothetical protein [Microbacterium album]|uniref:DUF3558 domain-containing protein n=1 Tax=Microbacterium album TaxID=2053191 RepID=A0A917MMR8_9MICO|nr:hypothetical protein [Microbacterium album]GGH49349.1 hypothetical protein GCM10010921_27480 [Microbacterium album]